MGVCGLSYGELLTHHDSKQKRTSFLGEGDFHYTFAPFLTLLDYEWQYGEKESAAKGEAIISEA